MHGSLKPKHLIMVAGFAPLFAFAQAGDAGKTATIGDLLTTMSVDAAIKSQDKVLASGAKQEASLMLEQALVEDKTLNDKQKQATVDELKKSGAVRRTIDGADRDFDTEAFRRDTLQAHYGSLGRYYSTQEIKDLTTFPKTPSGQKFMTNQGKTMQEVQDNVMQKYGPQTGREMRGVTDKGVAATAATE